MDTIGPWELLIIIVVLLALFGSSRLPGIGRSLGEGLREFQSGLGEASQSNEAASGSGLPEPSDSAPPGDPASTSP
jgi:sec-independent protein translocase protein TatA